MATVVFYIDEAGNPDRHTIPCQTGHTPLFTLTAVALPLSQWRSTDREYFTLKKRFFSDAMGRTSGRPEEWEVKGSDLTKPSMAKSKRRHEFLTQVLAFVGRHSGTCFAATFLKDPVNPVDPHSIYTHGLQILVERFSVYIAEHPVYSEGILILDSRMKGIKGSDIAVARSHMSYMFGNETGKRFINIQEAPLFADSRLTAGLQIADIMASLLYSSHYRYYLSGIKGALSYEHVAKYWPSVDVLQFKSRQTIGGFQMFGFRIIDQTKRQVSSPAPIAAPNTVQPPKV